MNKKIGILTYHWAHNPGTFLQAFSTLNAVKKKFPSCHVELVNCSLRDVKFKPSRYDINIFRLWERYRNHHDYEGMKKKYLSKSRDAIVSINYKTLVEYINRQKYNLIIVGADTILEVLPDHFSSAQIPIYWLPPEVNCKKVMFSASAGALTYSMLDEKYRQSLSDSLNSFDLIGVRDENTFNLIKQLSHERDVVITPDPTFSMGIDYSHIEKFLLQKKMKIKDSTIAVNLPESLPLCQKIIKYYQQKGFSVVMIGYGSRQRDCLFPLMTPLEWSGVHRYFSLEITDRFHGSIFSLKNLIPVVAIDHEKRKYTESGLSKTYSLLKSFEMHETNHINVDKCDKFDEIVHMTDKAIEFFDHKVVGQRLEVLRNEYTEFLNRIGQLLN